ncbi:uncharacterized protein LOC131934834 [Physella acuta]|uniref:uncharacterized protein LOC131934834 n=1 Tax=Physella acuta TaxID=109671 RepID=UPI0027DCD7F9|nr:uncharacterized protein LOC131934834 [Physella acuta]
MKFSSSLIFVFCFKVMNCNLYPVYTYALKIGDPFTCTCRGYSTYELTWTLQKENGEIIPLINRCEFPFKNCTVEFLHGGISYKADDVYDRRAVVWTHLTIQRTEVDMMGLLCSVTVDVDRCYMKVVDNVGDSSDISAVKIGDPFTCTCKASRLGALTWKLHKNNGEHIPLITKCLYPFKNCTVQYHQGGITLEAGDEHLHRVTTRLTVQHAEQDMTGIFCSSKSIRERCLFNFVDNVEVIHELNEGDQFTCECRLFDDMDAEWTLEKVGGEKISLVSDCYWKNNCFHGNYTGSLHGAAALVWLAGGSLQSPVAPRGTPSEITEEWLPHYYEGRLTFTKGFHPERPVASLR